MFPQALLLVRIRVPEHWKGNFSLWSGFPQLQCDAEPSCHPRSPSGSGAQLLWTACVEFLSLQTTDEAKGNRSLYKRAITAVMTRDCKPRHGRGNVQEALGWHCGPLVAKPSPKPATAAGLSLENHLYPLAGEKSTVLSGGGGGIMTHPWYWIAPVSSQRPSEDHHLSFKPFQNT